MTRLLVLCACLLVVAGCGQVRRPTAADRLTDEEKLDYLVLRSLDEDAAVVFAGEPTRSSRAGYLAWFWDNAEAARGADSAALRERAGDAKGFFGSIDLLNDDRVTVYIRHGPPRREEYAPEPYRSETLTVIVNPAEIWTYEKLGLQFDFVKRGTAYKLVGDTRFGAGAIAPMLVEVDRGEPYPAHDVEAPGLGLEVAVARFGEEDDTVETEVHYGIPQDVLARLGRDPAPVLHFDFWFDRPGTGRGEQRHVWASPHPEPDPASPYLAVGRQAFRLPADDYTLEVRATSDDGRFHSETSQRVNLLDYVRKAQPASDMVFYSLADSNPQSPQFEGHGWQRLVPLVKPEVRAGGTFYVLYELYNLGTSDEGRHRVEAEYQLIHEDTRRLAVVPTPTKFVTGNGGDATVVERVHTMDLNPGPYLLVARVRDLESGTDISLTARFRIQPRT